MEKGWMPPFVAADAKNIRLTGDQDAASVYGSYLSADTVLLRKHCTEVDNSFRVPVDGAHWFHIEGKKNETAGQLRSRGYDVLHCDESGFDVLLLTSRQEVYFWSTRR